MNSNDPFGFDIRVTSDKKKRQRTRRGMSGAFETSQRACEHPGCEERGQYRAPKSPDVLDDYYWFCKEHVREYNLKWNFFTGSSEEEYEEQMERDRVWERPTKPFGKTGEEQRAWSRLGVDDPHQILGENATRKSGQGHGRRPETAPDRTPRPRDPRSERSLEQIGNSKAIQKFGQGSSSRHEWRKPVGRRPAARGRLGLGSNQGQPELPTLTPSPPDRLGSICGKVYVCDRALSPREELPSRTPPE